MKLFLEVDIKFDINLIDLYDGVKFNLVDLVMLHKTKDYTQKTKITLLAVICILMTMSKLRKIYRG
jgi:hypothetical protein